MTPDEYEHHIFKVIENQRWKWRDEQSQKRRKYKQLTEAFYLMRMWEQQYLWKIEHDLDYSSFWKNKQPRYLKLGELFR